jgi:hypothetical protein
MAQAAIKIEAAAAAAIDREHLARMTFGERGLEREVLMLFDRQCGLLLARMRDGDAAVMAPLAHTLKGSASGIGAWGVARAAAGCEQAAAGSPAERSLALEELGAAIEEARAEIAPMLGIASAAE